MASSNVMYPGEGWGLSRNDHRLILSEGSSKSRFLDPETIVELGRLEAFDGDTRESDELEFGEGKIHANVLPQDRIVMFNRIPVRSPAGSVWRN